MIYISDVINSGCKKKVKSKRIMEVKRYFLSMYRCYMLKMYDMDYIDDPTKFDSQAILRNILDMGIEDFFNYSGKLDLNAKHALFALYKNKHDSERKEFLEVLYNILKYREFSQTVDMLYEEFSFQGKTSENIRYAMYLKGAKVIQRSGIDFNEAFARCVSDFDTETKVININEELWDLAMAHLNIPEKERKDDGLLDGSLTHEEEVACIEGILNGYYKVSKGKYIKRFQGWMLGHRWNVNSVHKTDTQGLYDYLYSANVSDIDRIVNDKLNSIEGICILAINKNEIYYNVNRTSYKMPFGVFSVVCDRDIDEYLLPDINILNGYTGELYTEDRLISDGINFVGCPIILNSSSDEEKLYFDLEQTDIQSNSWFSSDDDVSIEYDSNARYSKTNPFSKDTVQYKIYEGYVNSLCSVDGLIYEISISNYKDFEKLKKSVFRYI